MKNPVDEIVNRVYAENTTTADSYPDCVPEKLQDKMISEGRLLFDGRGVIDRPRPHVEAFVENQIRLINGRRKAQGKPEIKGEIDTYGQLGIFVDVKIMDEIDVAQAEIDRMQAEPLETAKILSQMRLESYPLSHPAALARATNQRERKHV